jgi:hypothetical protein
MMAPCSPDGVVYLSSGEDWVFVMPTVRDTMLSCVPASSLKYSWPCINDSHHYIQPSINLKPALSENRRTGCCLLDFMTLKLHWGQLFSFTNGREVEAGKCSQIQMSPAI